MATEEFIRAPWLSAAVGIRVAMAANTSGEIADGVIDRDIRAREDVAAEILPFALAEAVVGVEVANTRCSVDHIMHPCVVSR